MAFASIHLFQQIVFIFLLLPKWATKSNYGGLLSCGCGYESLETRTIPLMATAIALGDCDYNCCCQPCKIDLLD